jgi:hypothetical protein
MLKDSLQKIETQIEIEQGEKAAFYDRKLEEMQIL